MSVTHSRPLSVVVADSDVEKPGSDDNVVVSGYPPPSAPSPTMTMAQEKALARKMDFYILPVVGIMYVFAFIDRANIGNARIAGMATELQFTGYDYNKVLSSFYISYIFFEIPANMLCKYIGPGWFIPITAILFGLGSLATAFVKTTAQLCAVRFIVGIFEAGMFPGIAYYLSRWYTDAEFTFRMGVYLVTTPLSGAFGGLLAAAILTVEQIGNVHGWRVLFLVEGLMTIGVALIGLCVMTDRPETARWLTPDQKAFATHRLLKERRGAEKIIDKFNWTKMLRGMNNPVTIITAVIFLLNNVTVQGFAFFTPTIVKGLYPNSSNLTVQLRTVPPYVIGCAMMLLATYAGWKLNRRVIWLTMAAPLMMLGYALVLGAKERMVRYGATFLMSSGAFVFGALTNAIVAANSVSDTARASAIGLNVMMGNIGGLVSTWSYLEKDAPNYPIGNGLNMGTSTGMFLLSVGLLLWMQWDNKKRNRRNGSAELVGMDDKTIAELEWKHPDWRWKT